MHILCVARWIIKLKVRVDSEAIRNNLMRIRAATCQSSRTRVRVLFMVKANAYGHGLEEVARATEDIVDGFGVATLEEGVALRKCGITKPILLLICADSELKSALDNRITVCLSNLKQLSALEKLISSGINKNTASGNNKIGTDKNESDGEVNTDSVKVHIALDSGMHRLGFSYGQLDGANGVLARLKRLGVNVEGAYSHLRVRSRKQIATFEKMCEKVREFYPNAIRHLASSHSLECKKLQYDMVRVGISAYQGAMSVESEVIASRRVPAGEYVSYGNYKVKKDTNTAVVFGGYADGVAREYPSAVYIRGRKCKVLGRVCMDMTVVDCGDFLPDIGEKAVFVDGKSIKDAAKQRRSIEYTLMTCWRGRVERVYDDESGSKAVREKGDCRDERRGKGVGERSDLRRS